MTRTGLILLTLCLTALPSVPETPGTFRGVVVASPPAMRSAGWIFVKGKNGMLRKVEIKSATIHYEDTYPATKRKDSARSALKPGIEIRVTATMGKDGEWHASDIEIVVPAADQELPPDPDPDHRVT